MLRLNNESDLDHAAGIIVMAGSSPAMTISEWNGTRPARSRKAPSPATQERVVSRDRPQAALATCAAFWFNSAVAISVSRWSACFSSANVCSSRRTGSVMPVALNHAISVP